MSRLYHEFIHRAPPEFSGGGSENSLIVIEDGVFGELKALLVALKVQLRGGRFVGFEAEYFGTTVKLKKAMDMLDVYGALESMYPYLQKAILEARTAVSELNKKSKNIKQF